MTNQIDHNNISAQIREISVQQQRLIATDLSAVTDLGVQQAMVLAMVAARPGLIQKDIVAVIRRKASAVSSLLKILETAGLIERKVPAANTRNKEIYITPAGQAVVTAFTAATTAVAAQAERGLTPAEQQELSRLLGIVGRNLKE